jgi:hypothetical protein
LDRCNFAGEAVTMARRVFALGLWLTLSFLTIHCGSSSPSAPKTATGVSGTGTLYAYIGDSPICDVLALRLNVTQMTLGVANSTNSVPVLSSLNTVISIDFASLQDAATPLAIRTVDAGSYDRVNLDLTAGTMYIYDPTMNPPIRSLSANINTSTPPLFSINPHLNLASGNAALLMMDFDLQQMVQVDSQGNVTGVITPFANVSAPVASTTTGVFGSFSGIEGFLQTVQANSFMSGNYDFTGAVSVQSLPPTNGVGGGPSVTADFTKATVVCGQPVPPQVAVSNTPCTSQPLNTILTNSYALLDGFMDAGGNLETNSITIGPQEDPVDNMVALIGPVLAVTTDSAGVVTGFTMFVQKTEPPPSVGAITLDTAVDVTLPTGIVYNTYPPAPAPGTTIPSANFASLPFAPSEIAVGEDVVVHGVYTTAPSGVTPSVTMAADEVDLRAQTVEGSFISLLAQQSDDLTGVFTLSPCATIFQKGDAAALPIYIVTAPSTSYVNINGLSSLNSQHNLLLKGLLFYEPQSITLNGFAIPAGKLVMLAEQVNQIP